MADVEFTLQHLNDSGLNNICKSQITNMITNYVHKNNNNDTVLRGWIHGTKQFLKEHLEIIVTKADKGNTTLPMYKESYIQLSTEHFSNE